MIALLVLAAVSTQAQYDLLSAKKNVINGGYNFWVYTPEDYYFSQESTPLVLFLHGASLCGHDLNRVLRYGTIDAVQMGLELPALVVAPQNPGGPWKPSKLKDILEWMKEHYAYDTTRVYVLGMSLGGYGTIDLMGTYPEMIAAGMALCGGTTLRDLSKLGDAPLWIIHGTGDRAVSVKESQKVVNAMKQMGIDSRLRYDYPKGASHGALARYFYSVDTYKWLLSHSLTDVDRPVETTIDIPLNNLQHVYRQIDKRADQLEKELNSEVFSVVKDGPDEEMNNE